MSIHNGVAALLMLLGGASIVQGGIYHVSTNGSDGNNGTDVSTAWRTLGRANRAVIAGDAVIVHEGEYIEGIQPLRSGEPGNPIAFQSAPGEHVVLKTAFGVWLQSNHSYIVVDGFEIQASSQLVILSGSSYVTIRNCVMYGGRANYNALLLSGASYCVIQNNFVDRQDEGLDDLGGDGIKLLGESNHNLIEGNTVTRCEHVGISSALSTATVYQSYNVVRNNRAYVNHTNFSLQDGVQRTLFENNVGYYPGLVWRGGNGWCLQFTGTNCIIRYNTFYDDTATVFTKRQWPAIVGASSGSINGSAPSVLYNKIYNNTIYAENDQKEWQKDGWRIDNFAPEMTQNYNVFKNNIFAVAPRWQIIDVDALVPLEEMDNRYDGNLLCGAPGRPANVRYEFKGGTATWTIDEVKRARPVQWGPLNKGGDPMFVNTIGQGPAKDFNLQAGSPAIDAGTYVTVASIGDSGTTLVVEDAGYFCDGWGIPGVEGDSIKIEGDAPVGIIRADYGTNTLTLSGARIWSQGARVFYYRADRFQGLAPDIGSHEFSSGPISIEPPLTPTLLSPDDGATAPSNFACLAWNPAPGASSYRIQVSSDQQFASTSVDQAGLVATSYTARSLDVGTAYYWRVAACNKGGDSPWSAKRSFTAGEEQPADSNLIANASFNGGISPWCFYTSGIGSVQPASPGFDDNHAANVRISECGPNTQFYQFDISLERDAIYHLSFAAYSSSGRDVEVVIQKHGAPFTNYGLNEHFDLTDSWALYSTEFAATTPADVSDGRLMFWLGATATGGDQYWIDRIMLKKMSVTTVQGSGRAVPSAFALLQNYPNPFNPNTGIRFQVPGVSDVRLIVYDILGREVAVLVNERKAAGTHEVPFDATGLASGVYIYRLTASLPAGQAGSFTATRLMSLVR